MNKMATATKTKNTNTLKLIKLETLNIDDFDTLKELLKFESVSGKESKVALYIKERLTELNFEVKKDSKGNIYATRGIADEYPLLNAHMDIVNLSNRFGGTYSSKYSTTNYKGQKKETSKKYSSLMVESYDYDGYLSKEIEEIRAKKVSEKAKSSVEISDSEAIKIWENDKADIDLLFGEEYKIIGFKCANCVNTCKAFKLCYFFKPNDLIETKRQYAIYKKENNEINETEDGLAFQQSFDIDNNIKVINKREVINTKESSKEKYIIKVDLINDKISGSGKKRVLGGDDKCGVFIALKVAELLPDLPLKVLFTVEEETGCNGVKFFVKEKPEWLTDVKYSLTIDRKDSCHLLWSQRGTRSCNNKFAGELMYQGVRQGIPVKLRDGGSADVVTLRDYVPNAVNMSAGYYKAHTSDEYIIPSDVDKIVGWVRNIVKNV